MTWRSGSGWLLKSWIASLTQQCHSPSQPKIKTARSCFSVTQSFLTLWLHELQHSRLPCPSLSPGVCSNSCPLSWWCHPTILSSVAPFSSCLQSSPAPEFFPMRAMREVKNSVGKQSLLRCLDSDASYITDLKLNKENWGKYIYILGILAYRWEEKGWLKKLPGKTREREERWAHDTALNNPTLRDLVQDD